LRLQNALARYLAAWWPSAESAGSGRPGSDILGTPGIVWENKTAREFRPLEWVRQCAGHGLEDVHVTVYWPTGAGAASAERTIAMLPMAELVLLLREAGYTVPDEPPVMPDPMAPDMPGLLDALGRSL
jgi:hypothetical protein